MRQAIILTDDGLVSWRICASLCLYQSLVIQTPWWREIQILRFYLSNTISKHYYLNLLKIIIGWYGTINDEQCLDYLATNIQLPILDIGHLAE